MKYINSLLIIAALVIGLASCSKQQTPSPTNNGNNGGGGGSTTGKYWARFKLDGVQKEFRSNDLQTGHGISATKDQVGGYVNDGSGIFTPALGITIYNRNDTISNQEFMSYVGKTFYFDDTTYYVELVYQNINPVTSQFDSYTFDSYDHKYNITISNITKIGSSHPDKDLNGNYYGIYEVTGSCSGYLESSDGSHNVEVTDGQFFFRWTKQE